MANIFSTFFLHSFVISGFIILLILFYPILSKWYSNQSIYYLWLTTAIAFMFPFKVSFFESVIVNENAKTIFFVPNFTINQQITKQEFTNIAIDWFFIGFILWITGIAIFTTYHIIKYIYFLHIVKRWSNEVTCEATLSIFEKVKQELKIKKEIQIKECSVITSPMEVGFHKFFIFVPIHSFSEEQLYFILKHELIHYKRKDLWCKILILIINIVHWFNPFVYIMRKKIILQCELCCDSEVSKNMEVKEKLQYVETMIHIVKNDLKCNTVLSNNFLAEKNNIKRRVFSIMDNKKKKKGILCMVVLIVCFCLSNTVFGIDVKIKENKKQYESWEDSLTRNIAPYSIYGVTYDRDLDAIFYNGKRVSGFVDINKERSEYGYSFRICFQDEDGDGIYIQTKQDDSGNVIGIEAMLDVLKQDVFGKTKRDNSIKNQEIDKEIKENLKEIKDGFKEIEKDFEGTKDVLYYTFDATLFLEDGESFLTDKIDKEDIPKNISDWIKQCESKEGIYETKSIGNRKRTGWIYCNKGKRYFWNIKNNKNELQLYLYDATKEKGENTLIYYEIPNSYTKITTYVNDEITSYES